jgi:hypothetical protein
MTGKAGACLFAPLEPTNAVSVLRVGSSHCAADHVLRASQVTGGVAERVDPVVPEDRRDVRVLPQFDGQLGAGVPYSAEGARVLITGRTQETLNAAAEQLGGNAVAVRSDTASLSDIKAVADRVKAEFGTVDALFGNAAVNGFGPFETITEELFDQNLTVNAKGPYFTIQKLAPLMGRAAASCSPRRLPTRWASRCSARTRPAKRPCGRSPAAWPGNCSRGRSA